VDPLDPDPEHSHLFKQDTENYLLNYIGMVDEILMLNHTDLKRNLETQVKSGARSAKFI
jgi:hypothetical protein